MFGIFLVQVVRFDLYSGLALEMSCFCRVASQSTSEVDTVKNYVPLMNTTVWWLAMQLAP